MNKIMETNNQTNQNLYQQQLFQQPYQQQMNQIPLQAQNQQYEQIVKNQRIGQQQMQPYLRQKNTIFHRIILACLFGQFKNYEKCILEILENKISLFLMITNNKLIII